MSLTSKPTSRKKKRKISRKARAINRANKKSLGRNKQTHTRTACSDIKKRKTRKEQREKRHKVRKEEKDLRRLNRERDRANQLGEQITRVLDQPFIQAIAKATFFFVRTSKITPLAFLITLSYGLFGNGAKSLDILASNMKTWFGIRVTAQALSDRLGNDSTVKFLRKILEKTLQFQVNNAFKNGYAEIFTFCSAVKLEDSTRVELNEKLAKNFKGSGGGASKSAIKMNICYDLTKKAVCNLELRSSTYTDQKFAKRATTQMKPGELIIRDLGYFVLNVLARFVADGVYFVSRVQKVVCIYLNEDDEKAVVFNDFLKQEIQKDGAIDRQIYIGKEKIPVRLLAAPVPEYVVEQRIKKYRAARKKEPTTDYVTWSGFSVLITNIPKTCCSKNIIFEIYKIRWQIELFFKCLKSTLKIHIIRGKNKNRVLSIIYLKMISLLMASTVVSYASSICEEDEEISDDKMMKWLQDDNRFLRAILKGIVATLLEEMLSEFFRFCKNKRKGHKSSYMHLKQAFAEEKEEMETVILPLAA